MKLLTIIALLMLSSLVLNAQNEDIKIDTVITGIEEEMIKSINVYPNPAKDQVTVGGDFDSAIVLNAHGNIVAINNAHNISLEGLSRGLYYVRVRNKSAVITKKIVIED